MKQNGQTEDAEVVYVNGDSVIVGVCSLDPKFKGRYSARWQYESPTAHPPR